MGVEKKKELYLCKSTNDTLNHDLRTEHLGSTNLRFALHGILDLQVQRVDDLQQKPLLYHRPMEQCTGFST